MCVCVKSEGLICRVLEENVQSERVHGSVSMRSKTTSNSPLALKTTAVFWVLMLLYVLSAASCARCDCAKSRYARVQAFKSSIIQRGLMLLI